MTGLATAVACLAGITFYVAVHYLLIYSRMKEWRPSLPFSMLCFAVGLYDIACIGLYNASTPQAGAVWQKWQFFALYLIGILALRFVSIFVERKATKLDQAFTAAWCAGIVALMFGPGRWFSSGIPAVKDISVPGFGRVVYQEVELGILPSIGGLVGIAAIVYVINSLIACYRRGNRKKALPVLIGAALWSVGMINDTAVGQGYYPFIYVIEYSFLFLILGMAYSLLDAHLAVQRDLRASQAAMRLTQFSVDHNADAIIWADNTGRLIYVNEAACSSLGYTREELLSLHVHDIGPETSADDWDWRWNNLKKQRTGKMETTHRRKDGSEFPVEITADYLAFSGKEYLCASVRDMTKRKKAEEELKRLAAAVDEAAESIIVTDPDGRIAYVNPAFERMTGYDSSEILGRKPGILQSGKHDDQFYAELWSTISEGNSWRGRFTNRKKDGSLFEEEAVISPVRDASGNTVNYVAVKRDVTQEVALQSQLRHSQKMDALGQLAGGVAHDFTNMLVVILGRAQIAKSKIGADSSNVHTDLDEIIEAGNKLSILTGELLAFAHKAPICQRNMDLNRTVRGMKELLNRTVGKRINLTVKTADTRLLVNIDAPQIEQAVMHLAINARGSMPDGGRLLIEASWTELSEAEAIQIRTRPDACQARAGRFATIGVSDNGIGMSQDVVTRIFDPFFSTKHGRRGSGLGMSTAYGIVAQHEGCIVVYSNPGRGTTFTIYLPLLAEPDTDRAAGPPHGNGETILLVDDDGVARRVLVRTIQDLGYTVLEAESGRQCLDLVRKHKGNIDLLITDYVMPEMQGPTLLKEMKAIRPGLKALMASGYPRGLLADLHEDQPTIQKPFTEREVAIAVAALLGNAG